MALPQPVVSESSFVASDRYRFKVAYVHNQESVDLLSRIICRVIRTQLLVPFGDLPPRASGVTDDGWPLIVGGGGEIERANPVVVQNAVITRRTPGRLTYQQSLDGTDGPGGILNRITQQTVEVRDFVFPLTDDQKSGAVGESREFHIDIGNVAGGKVAPAEAAYVTGFWCSVICWLDL